MAYVSLTLIHVKSLLVFPRFAKHAYRSNKAAMRTIGCLGVQTKALSFLNHSTMSLWDDRKSMLQFLRGPVHLDAIKVFDEIGTGRVYGYEADQLPNWERAETLLREEGRSV